MIEDMGNAKEEPRVLTLEEAHDAADWMSLERATVAQAGVNLLATIESMGNNIASLMKSLESMNRVRDYLEKRVAELTEWCKERDVELHNAKRENAELKLKVHNMNAAGAHMAIATANLESNMPEVLKTKNGVPSLIVYQGRRYTLDHTRGDKK